jgi:hypothetical protein
MIHEVLNGNRDLNNYRYDLFLLKLNINNVFFLLLGPNNYETKG